MAFASGTDEPDSEAQYGLEAGRACSSGVLVDLFWRGQEASFDRQPSGADCGTLQFVGVKASIERALPDRALYLWGGIGGGAFWTDDHIDDDSGLGLLGEVGVGYPLSPSVQVRLGVSLDGYDTDVGRDDPTDDGSSRWLWVLAPALQIEFRL